MVREEAVKENTLFEVFKSFDTSDVLGEIKVSIDVDTSSDKSMPVNGLELNVSVVFLELEVNSLTKVNVWSLNGMHVFTCHFKLVEIEVFGEHLHFMLSNNKY